MAAVPVAGALRVAGRSDAPLGVDDPRPALSWRLLDGRRQSAYRVQVRAEHLLWDTGEVASGEQRVVYGGEPLRSRQRVSWRVRVWDGSSGAWSAWSHWEMGLLEPEDWGQARWIQHPSREPGDPLPVFARTFTAEETAGARLYVCGLGLHEVTLNGRPVSDEVLAPGNSNYQRSAEYRVHDVSDLLLCGKNTIGVRLGHGTAHVHRGGAHPGRPSPYAWWTSHPTGAGHLRAGTTPGATRLESVRAQDFSLGATITVGTGAALETRRITGVGTVEIAVEPPLCYAHGPGEALVGSGSPVADLEASAAAAVTPRLIARLELPGGAVVTGQRWRTALGASVTDNWFSGTDYDARREQSGWDEPGADLSGSATRRDGSPTGWVHAAAAPPPSLDTVLVWRNAPPVRVVRTWDAWESTEPRPGVRVLDFGQNAAGWPELHVRPGLPAGTRILLRPAESLRPDGTVDQESIRDPARGTDVFHVYTTRGDAAGERWRPAFAYSGMRYVQVETPPGVAAPEVRAAQLRADLPESGNFECSSARLNRLHRMVHWSVASNAMSVLTDCPGREKLAYGADYTHPFGALCRHFDFAAQLRTMQRHLVEGQSRRGNVALKAPVYDWGYTGRFGDEVNWGNAVILVPWTLHEVYGDTETMERHFGSMWRFLRYITEDKAEAHLVTGPLGDWVASEPTSGELTGTWGYYLCADRMARMAAVLGRARQSQVCRELAEEIATAFHARFFSHELGCYTGDGGESGATQAAQGLALDAGLVPAELRGQVLDALVDRVRAYRPRGGGPHLSCGHIGLGPVIRSLSAGDRDELLWEVLQEDAPPSYGHFLRPTAANPGGLTTMPEQWDLRNSLNHMILTQVDEWFHSGLAGIGQSSHGFREPVIRPKVVGDLARVEAHHDAPPGRIASRWQRSQDRFTLAVTVPPNTSAQVFVPGTAAREPEEVTFLRAEEACRVYTAPPGTHTFDTQLR